VDPERLHQVSMHGGRPSCCANVGQIYILKNGKGEMPPENRGSDNALWDWVNYIRSLATKKTSSKGGTAPDKLH
jgi:hypothetical protein